MWAWNEPIDRSVKRAIDELRDIFPSAQVSIREVIDDRGVVSILVAVGDGRLVAAARSVDLVPVAWPWPDGFASVFGLLPPREIPTVSEVIAGLVVGV